MDEYQTAYIALLTKQVAAAEKQAALAEANLLLAQQNTAALIENSRSQVRQAAAMEAHSVAIAQHTEAMMSLMNKPDPQRADYGFMACLSAAAEARIENEPASLFKAGEDLFERYQKKFAPTDPGAV